LRETIAAAILKWAGYTGQEILLDPMCGSGTISLEAALISRNIPPGWYRGFAFMSWPCFRLKRWLFIKKEAEKTFCSPSEPRIFASDINQRLIEILHSNAATHGLDKAIQCTCANFFDISPWQLSQKKGMIVLNPPYGKRLSNKKNSLKLYRDIIQKLQADFRGWKVVLIMLDLECLSQVSFPYRLQPFFHGGLRLHALIGAIN
jgi:putative N6-adenine-specific DNA methylase